MTNDRSKWSTQQWYKHVGAWETPEGHIFFGSPMAVHAMLMQFGKTMIQGKVPTPQEFDQDKFVALVREFAEVVYGQRRTTEDVGANLVNYIRGLIPQKDNSGEADDASVPRYAVEAFAQQLTQAGKKNDELRAALARDEDGERWRFLVRAADNKDGPEHQAMEDADEDLPDPDTDDRPEGVKFQEFVDRARAKLKQSN